MLSVFVKCVHHYFDQRFPITLLNFTSDYRTLYTLMAYLSLKFCNLNKQKNTKLLYLTYPVHALLFKTFFSTEILNYTGSAVYSGGMWNHGARYLQ
jgi:hypothetical protein